MIREAIKRWRHRLTATDRLEIALKAREIAREADLTDAAAPRDTESWFRALDESWYEITDGQVEAPTGWFGLLNIDARWVGDWARHETEDIPAQLQWGWYLVVIRDDGRVEAWHGAEQMVDVAFRGRVVAYDRWLDPDLMPR